MITGQFDHVFQTKLHAWTRLGFAAQSFFSTPEFNRLTKAAQSFDALSRTIVFTFFENKYAALGGLAAIAKTLPKFMKDKGENVLFISPFHRNNKKIRKAIANGNFVTIFEDLRFTCGSVVLKIGCLQDITAEVPSYFCSLDDYFTAETDPYAYPDTSLLAQDALAFCAAVPAMLSRLGFKKNLLIHAHDWECAAMALTSQMAMLSDELSCAKTVLTLHNSYDANLPTSLMSRFFGRTVQTDTFLQTFIPLLNGPLTTVSTPFAHELRFDPLQTGVFTRHLQQVFSKNPPIGIENGVFGNPSSPFSQPALALSEKKDFSLLIKEKARLRTAMNSSVQSEESDRVLGKLTLSGPSDKSPFFFMTGRPDFMQKGFDTMLLGFQKLKRGTAKLFFGLNIESKSADFKRRLDIIEFLKNIERDCRGDIAIWLFRIPSDHYSTLLRGASFQLMPSFYEPFGSATEGFASGTPVIARATGGLWAQVEPCNKVAVPGFYGNLFKHGNAAPSATGILYRENYSGAFSGIDWNSILKLPLSERHAVPLYQSIVDSAYEGLKTAVEIFSQPARYGELIASGLRSLSLFPWAYSVEKYIKIYDKTCRSAL